MMNSAQEVNERETNETDIAAGAFSPDRYRPMERLLLTEEFRFLESQPGYTPEIGAEWKRGRKRIFRMYLDELKCDFRRLHARARTLVTESGVESSDLVGVLIRQQVSFWRAIAMVELRLTFAGTEFPHIDIRPVVDLLAAMHKGLQHPTPQTA